MDALWRTCQAAGALTVQPADGGARTCDVPIEVVSVPADPNHLFRLKKDVGVHAF